MIIILFYEKKNNNFDLYNIVITSLSNEQYCPQNFL